MIGKRWPSWVKRGSLFTLKNNVSLKSPLLGMILEVQEWEDNYHGTMPCFSHVWLIDYDHKCDFASPHIYWKPIACADTYEGFDQVRAGWLPDSLTSQATKGLTTQ